MIIGFSAIFWQEICTKISLNVNTIQTLSAELRLALKCKNFYYGVVVNIILFYLHTNVKSNSQLIIITGSGPNKNTVFTVYISDVVIINFLCCC